MLESSYLREGANGNSIDITKRIIRIDADREKIKQIYKPL